MFAAKNNEIIAMVSNADSLEGRAKSKFLDSKDSLISDLVKLPENFTNEIKKSLN